MLGPGEPQFSAREFIDFDVHYDFVRTVSSQRFPRSNELTVIKEQVVKRLLRKTACTKEKFWLGLLN